MVLLSLRRETLLVSVICEDHLTLEKAVLVVKVPGVFHDLEPSIGHEVGDDLSRVTLGDRLQLDCT